MIGISKLSPRRLLVVVLNKGGGLTEVLTSEPSVACFYKKYDTNLHYRNYP